MCHISLLSFALINAKSFSAYMYPQADQGALANTQKAAKACIRQYAPLLLSGHPSLRPQAVEVLLVQAVLLPWPTAHSAMPSKGDVPFLFSVVPALGADFGVSAPGFYAAIPFDPPCSVHLIHLYTLMLDATRQDARARDLFLCNRHLDHHRLGQKVLLQQKGTNSPSPFHRCLQL